MKLFSALLITLASTVALAMPAVNDSASYDITFTQGGQTLTGTQDLVITAYNQATKLYTVKSTVTFNGQTQVKESQTPAEKLLSDAAAEQLMAKCSEQGGAVTQVTVGAGTLAACAVPVNENGATGTLYLGTVPFGLIKMEVNANGQSMLMTLRAFNKGS
ncbi:MAG: hypothetical protein ABL958_09840 [Bdellovibrionia bacterium]